MQFKFGPMILEGRGSIGGVTVSRNSAGPYMRARVKPVNPNTERQNQVKSGLAAATAKWSTLSDASRILWNEYAALVAMKNKVGDTIFNSGFNHYVRNNSFRMALGFASIDAAPFVGEIPAHDPSITIAPAASSQQLNVTFDNGMDWASEDGAVLFCHQGRPQNPQRFYFTGPWRWCTCVGGDSGTPPGPAEPAPCVYHITETQKQWAYFRIQRADSRLSETFTAEAMVGA